MRHYLYVENNSSLHLHLFPRKTEKVQPFAPSARSAARLGRRVALRNFEIAASYRTTRRDDSRGFESLRDFSNRDVNFATEGQFPFDGLSKRSDADVSDHDPSPWASSSIPEPLCAPTASSTRAAILSPRNLIVIGILVTNRYVNVVKRIFSHLLRILRLAAARSIVSYNV